MVTPSPRPDEPVDSPTSNEASASYTQREVAEGFGGDAGKYDRARPDYPLELVERIVAGSPGVDLLDVGCGTGISSRLFQTAGCRVLGIDPDSRMAAVAAESGIATEITTFEEWDPAGRTYDIVVAAQSWHWVDPVAGAAKAAQVLRPNGRLAVFWNAFDPPHELRAGFAEVFRRVLPDSPFGAFWARPALDTYRAGRAKAAEAMRQVGGFEEPEEWLSHWEIPYTRAEWLDLVPTTGGFTQNSPTLQRELLDGLGAVVDAAGGSFVMSYATVTATATRLG